MKNTLIYFALLCSIVLFACKTSHYEKMAGTPFDQSLFSDSLKLYVVGLGESKVLSTARTIALHDAQVKMSVLLSSVSTNNAENFTKQYNMSGKTETATKFEVNSSSKAQTGFSNLKIVDEKYFKDKSQMYHYWILLEKPIQQQYHE